MATEEPKVRLHIELGANHPLAVFPAGLGNFADAVEHQHRRQRQLRIAGAKQLAAAAGQQILVFVTAAPIQHSASLSQYRWSVLELNEPASHRKRVIFAHWPRPAGQDGPAATGVVIAEIAYLRPGALYHRPRRRQSMTTGVNSAVSPSVPLLSGSLR